MKDQRNDLPYPSLVSKILRKNQVFSQSSFLPTPYNESGLDARVFGKIHYYKDSRNNWYYDDMCGTWLYDHVIVPARTPTKMVEVVYQNNLREEAELEEGIDQDMEEIGYEDEESDP